MARIFCFGGAHFDFTARCKTRFRAGASNPVTVVGTIGGAALNTALNLKRLGNDVSLVSAVGEDAPGDSIARTLAALSMPNEGLLRYAGQRTAAYTAILDGKGDLVAGLADMDIYEDVAAAAVFSALERLPDQPDSGDYIFLDANLPAAVLAELTGAFQGRDMTLAAAAISPAKVGRLRALLPSLDILFCNIAELAALTAVEVGNEAELCAAAQEISAQRQTTLLVTRGAEGVMLFEQGTASRFPSAIAQAIDVNGAGDAFAAGTLHLLTQGQPFPETVSFGQATAALTLEVSGSTDEKLSQQRVLDRQKS